MHKVTNMVFLIIILSFRTNITDLIFLELFHDFVVVWSLSRLRFFATPWTAAHQASVPLTLSQSLPKHPLMPSSPPAFNLSQH